MSAKYIQITEAVKRQIHNGDYLMDKIPSERKLAEVFGVSYMTGRRAIQQLVSEEVFLRQPNGRLAINPEFGHKEEQLNVAMIMPNWPISSLNKWRKALQQVVEMRGGIVKTIFYDHNEDNVIQEALNGNFSRIFITMSVIPQSIRLKLNQLKDQAILIYQDLSTEGFTCLDSPSPDHIGLLTGHLFELGHRNISLLNTQPENEIIQGRINSFKHCAAARGMQYNIINHPVNPFEDAGLKAYEILKDTLTFENFAATAIVCTTIEAAQGGMRAIYDCGMQPGKELSICAYGGIEVARLSIPSITVTCTVDVERQCRSLISDIIDRRTPERLLYGWDRMDVWTGESTGPVSKKSGKKVKQNQHSKKKKQHKEHVNV